MTTCDLVINCPPNWLKRYSYTIFNYNTYIYVQFVLFLVPDRASNLEAQALGKSNSLGSIENIKEKSCQPSPLAEETSLGKKI